MKSYVPVGKGGFLGVGVVFSAILYGRVKDMFKFSFFWSTQIFTDSKSIFFDDDCACS